MPFLLRFPLVAFLVLVAPQWASACTIPVFRYALERWQLSTYDLYVFQRGPLDRDLRGQLKNLESAGGNWRLHLVDHRSPMEPSLEKMWRIHGEPSTDGPWAILQLAEPNTPSVVVWKGALTTDALEGLVNAPMQGNIHEQLAEGVTGVFLLLESGDEEKDQAAWAMLGEHLPRFEKQIKLPVQTGEGPQLKLPLPLDVRFRSHRLKKDSGKNSYFRTHLLATEDGLKERTDPILFVVFGRGRLLGSLYGDDLNPDQLFRVASFLCGECSCEVKELNPGMDLLFNVDWNDKLERIAESVKATSPPECNEPMNSQTLAKPAISDHGSPKDLVAETSPVALEGEIPVFRSDDHRQNWLPWATGLAGGFVVATGFWALRSRTRATVGA